MILGSVVRFSLTLYQVGVQCVLCFYVAVAGAGAGNDLLVFGSFFFLQPS